MASSYARFVIGDGSIHTGEYGGDTVRSNGTSYAIDEVQLLTPTAPTKIVCVGLNYRDHADELRVTVPAEPLLFLKPPSSLVAHRTPIMRPPGVNRLDYEGELCVVIGKRATRVSTNDALDYVVGLTIANDVTAREYQVPGSQWTRAKGYDTFAPVGPCLVDSKDWSGRTIETRVNGKRVQWSSTDRLIFDVPTLVSYVSAIMTLEPGDLILTGTPSGVGPLQDGDEVRVAIEGIGELVNAVAR